MRVSLDLKVGKHRDISSFPGLANIET